MPASAAVLHRPPAGSPRPHLHLGRERKNNNTMNKEKHWGIKRGRKEGKGVDGLFLRLRRRGSEGRREPHLSKEEEERRRAFPPPPIHSFSPSLLRPSQTHTSFYSPLISLSSSSSFNDPLITFPYSESNTVHRNSQARVCKFS